MVSTLQNPIVMADKRHIFHGFLVVFGLFFAGVSMASTADTLCSIHLSKVEGVHVNPIESATKKKLSLNKCKSEALARMKTFCSGNHDSSLQLKAKYDFFDPVKFDMKKGELSHSCSGSVETALNSN